MTSLTSIAASSSLSLPAHNDSPAYLADAAAAEVRARHPARARWSGSRVRGAVVAFGMVMSAVLAGGMVALSSAHDPAVAGPQAKAPAATGAALATSQSAERVGARTGSRPQI